MVDYLGNELINYNSNDGRQIKIYNGALGSYRQPNQLVITHMFGHLFDLIISIEGYNEHQSFRRKNRILDQPSGYFETLNNPFFHDGKIETLTYELNNFVRSLGIKYSILRKTYTYNFFYNLVRRISYKIYNRNKKKSSLKIIINIFQKKLIQNS